VAGAALGRDRVGVGLEQARRAGVDLVAAQAPGRRHRIPGVARRQVGVAALAEGRDLGPEEAGLLGGVRRVAGGAPDLVGGRAAVDPGEARPGVAGGAGRHRSGRPHRRLALAGAVRLVAVGAAVARPEGRVDHAPRPVGLDDRGVAGEAGVARQLGRRVDVRTTGRGRRDRGGTAGRRAGARRAAERGEQGREGERPRGAHREVRLVARVGRVAGILEGYWGRGNHQSNEAGPAAR
jgi:hypothetical protein